MIPQQSEARTELKKRWSDFVRAILHRTGWTLEVLADKIGCSKASVSRWACDDPERGTIPHSVAAKALVELARREGLVED